MTDSDTDFALYVHWPYCLSKCPYCDFNSHVADQLDQTGFRDAILCEMDDLAETLEARGSAKKISSIFFGGGTPSLMAPQTVDAIIKHAQSLWPDRHPGQDLEITLEANPTSVESKKFEAFAEAGVNRLSLGIQALDDDALHFLGRQHSGAQALDALGLAQRYFPRVNADMIYARPGQSIASWRDELSRLFDAAETGHLSLYQLTMERGTPFFAAHRRGEFTLPNDEDAAQLFEVTETVLKQCGLGAYEISNYARPGEECRHNLTYWRYRDYAGLGPGAHGRLTLDGVKTATENLQLPNVWLDAVRERKNGTRHITPLSREQCIEEMVMMGLRLSTGIRATDFEAVAKGSFSDALSKPGMDRLIDGGFLVCEEDHLKATPKGRLNLDGLLATLLA
jgi:putative oxygen-independent coproporphyrinogen III oxidase